MAVVRSFEQEGGVTAKEISAATLTPLRTVQRSLKDLMPTRLVNAVAKGGFQLSLAEAATAKAFLDEQIKEESEIKTTKPKK
jgi:hypothetical protein